MRLFPLSQYDVPISARRLPIPTADDRIEEPAQGRMTPAMEELNPLVRGPPDNSLTIPCLVRCAH